MLTGLLLLLLSLGLAWLSCAWFVFRAVLVGEFLICYFNPKHRAWVWRNRKALFAEWRGKTGYDLGLSALLIMLWLDCLCQWYQVAWHAAGAYAQRKTYHSFLIGNTVAYRRRRGLRV